MEANSKNLARWIDELAASIEKLEKRMDVTPMSTLFDFMIDNEILIDHEEVTAAGDDYPLDFDNDVTAVALTFGTTIAGKNRIFSNIGGPLGILSEPQVISYDDNLIYTDMESPGVLNVRQMSGSDTITFSLYYSYVDKTVIESRSMMKKIIDKVKSITKGGK